AERDIRRVFYREMAELTNRANVAVRLFHCYAQPVAAKRRQARPLSREGQLTAFLKLPRRQAGT
ncbi:MAG TPA: hypothetical protein VMH06_03430, partial [Thermodesulfovibrionales bacterium]|nr:hypothetical protein [Thermodesulfovibrionales bacterium]